MDDCPPYPGLPMDKRHPAETRLDIPESNAQGDRTENHSKEPEHGATETAEERYAGDPLGLSMHNKYRDCREKVQTIRTKVDLFFAEHKGTIKWIILTLLILGYVVYLGFAVWYSPIGALVLIVLTCLIILVVAVKLINRKYGDRIDARCWRPLGDVFHSRQCRYFRW